MDSQGEMTAGDVDITLDAGGKQSMNTTLWFPVSVITTECRDDQLPERSGVHLPARYCGK